MPNLPHSMRPSYFKPEAAIATGTDWVIPLATVNSWLVEQDGDYWCWAATTALASRMTESKGPNDGFNQHEVATLVFAPDPPVDKEYRLLDAWRKANMYGVEKPRSEIENPATQQTLWDKVRAGMPLGIGIEWQTETGTASIGHALCAFGCGMMNGELAFAIYDPAKGVDRDHVIQLPLSALDHYYSADDRGVFGKWTTAVRFDGLIHS